MAGCSKYDFSYPIDDFVTVFDDTDDIKGKELVHQQNGNGNDLLHLSDHKNLSSTSNISFPQSVLLASLVEHLCNLYESDSKRAKKLFKVICLKLQKFSLIAPVAYLDEYSSIRMQYKTSLYDLLQSSLNIHPDPAIEGNNASSLIMANFSPDPKKQLSYLLRRNSILELPTIPTEDVFDIDLSRYSTEFTEIEMLGKGAYGQVFKAQHKLDNHIYAVKRILIEDLPENDSVSMKDYSQRLLREVSALSSLNHSNIVRYYHSWLEYQTLKKRNKKSNVKITQLSSPNKSSALQSDSSEKDVLHLANRSQDSSNTRDISFSSTTNTSASGNLGKFWDKRSLSQVSTSASGGFDSYLSWNNSNQQLNIESASAVPVAFDSGDFYSGVKFNKSDLIDFNPLSVAFEPESSQAIIPKKQTNVENPSSAAHCVITAPKKALVLYIQMQLCDLSLRQWLDSRNQLVLETSISSVKSTVDLTESMSIFQQILCGLKYIHGANLIHRDIKPSNIFLLKTDHSSTPVVQIGDFGLSRHMNSPVDPVTPLSMIDPFTDPLNVDINHTEGVGTTVYAAPEQLHRNDYSNKVDMYSTGIVLFELLWPIPTQHERADSLKKLRKGIVPDDFLCCWPAYGTLLQSLVHLSPEKRLSADCILKSNLFPDNGNSSATNHNPSQLLRIVELLVENSELQSQVFKYKQKLLSLGIDPDVL